MEQKKNINSDEAVGKSLEVKNDSGVNYRLLGGAAIVGISGISAILAGLVTSHIAKKKNQELLRELGKEMPPQVLLESSYSLAFRALAWGTVWAIGGCSLIAFGIWKWCGFKDLEDLRTRLRVDSKSSSTVERTEFESVRDFLNYLNESSKSEKKGKGT